MRIDLASQNISSLRVHGQIQLEHNLVEMARVAVPDGHGHSEDHLFIAVGGYRRNGIAHRISVDIRSHGDSQSLAIIYECPSVRGDTLNPPPPHVLRRTRQLETLLASEQFVQINSELHCDVRFQYKSSEVSTIIALPMMELANPDLPFSSINGIRLDKIVDGEYKYSAMMTKSQRHDILLCEVQFHAEHQMGTSLPQNYLTDALTIVQKFVSQKGSSDATS